MRPRVNCGLPRTIPGREDRPGRTASRQGRTDARHPHTEGRRRHAEPSPIRQDSTGQEGHEDRPTSEGQVMAVFRKIVKPRQRRIALGCGGAAKNAGVRWRGGGGVVDRPRDIDLGRPGVDWLDSSCSRLWFLHHRRTMVGPVVTSRTSASRGTRSRSTTTGPDTPTIASRVSELSRRLARVGVRPESRSPEGLGRTAVAPDGRKVATRRVQSAALLMASGAAEQLPKHCFAVVAVVPREVSTGA